MLSLGESSLDEDILVLDDGVETVTETEAFTSISVDDLGMREASGFGFASVGVGMLLSFGIAWIVSLLRKA